MPDSIISANNYSVHADPSMYSTRSLAQCCYIVGSAGIASSAGMDKEYPPGISTQNIRKGHPQEQPKWTTEKNDRKNNRYEYPQQ